MMWLLKMLKSILLTCTTNAYNAIHTHWKKFSSDKPFHYNILLRQELEIYSQPTMPAADDDRAQQLPGMGPKVIAIST